MAKGEDCKGGLVPVPNSVIKSRVAFGQGQKKDIKLVQQLINEVDPKDGGPAVKLAEDGICGPKTNAAIHAFQKKIMAKGFSDGIVDPGGKTITTLRDRVTSGEKLGKMGLASSFGEDLMGGGAVPEAVGHLKFLQPTLLTLSFKMGRNSDSVRRLAQKHFVNPTETLTDDNFIFIAGILREIRVFLDRANAFGKFPGANVILFSDIFKPTQPKLLAFTVRGGNKLSTNEFHIYTEDNGDAFTYPGQSIFLTSRWKTMSVAYKQEILIHEFCHFVGDRDDPDPPLPPNPNKIDDNGYYHQAHMKFLNKDAKLRNADSLALFFAEYCLGTTAMLGLPFNQSQDLLNRAPFVKPGGDIQ